MYAGECLLRDVQYNGEWRVYIRECMLERVYGRMHSREPILDNLYYGVYTRECILENVYLRMYNRECMYTEECVCWSVYFEEDKLEKCREI